MNELVIDLIRELFYTGLVASLVVISVCILLTYKTKKEIARLQKYEIDINADIGESIPQLLETIVNECLTEYIALNIAFKRDIDYIDDELESTIREAMIERVANNISPSVMNKLSLYYNPKSIGSVISDKIYIAVTAYVSEQNTINNIAMNKPKNTQYNGLEG